MSQLTFKKAIPAWARIGGLALALVFVLTLVLAAPARLRAETPLATNATQMLMFDWNKPVIRGMSGFAQYKPLSNYNMPNGNWVSPVNYTNGTMYFRARVLSIPQNQPAMKLGFCFWQLKPNWGEECTKNYPVPGVPGSEARWSQSFGSMAKIGGQAAAINWTQPRWKEGFVVRGRRGPVSNKLNFNWSGENPDHWYPMNIHYTVVLVAPGGGAPDWTKFGWPNN